MHKLYELKDMLCKELEGYAGKKLSAGSLDEIDKLAHAAKNIGKVIKAYEEEDYSGRHYPMTDGRIYDYSRKRDSMGRYSRDDRLIAELRDLHRAANDEMTRKQIESIISIAENM